ncbi:MAG: class I SAM-dependent methyltransferase [Candidatus Nitrosopumilus sp. bin_6a]
MIVQKIWLEFIRKQELESIEKYFLDSKKRKILEIGGKDGYFAKILTDWGFDVTSIDIDPSSTYFDVKKMNGTNLEFEENSFDLIFSSHVIAHVKNKNLLFKEINRVLKKDGLIIHIVPSNWWSIITNFLHYLLLPKYLFEKNKFDKFLKNNKENLFNHKKNKLINLLFLHPLGTEKSFIIEIVKFSKNKWKNLFVSYGYTICDELNGPLVYSGHNIFKDKGHKIRKYFASIFPSSYIFTMKNT